MRRLLLTVFLASATSCNPKNYEEGVESDQNQDTGSVIEHAEDDCSTDSLNAADDCYACGWRKDDPGNLVSTGSDIGDVIANVELVDQCGEQVRIWDFYGEYHILFMTAAW